MSTATCAVFRQHADPCVRGRPISRQRQPGRLQRPDHRSPTRTSSQPRPNSARRRSGWTRLSMKSTWSMQTVRKKRVNSVSASSLSAPRPSQSFRRLESQLASRVLYCWTLRQPRPTRTPGRIPASLRMRASPLPRVARRIAPEPPPVVRRRLPNQEVDAAAAGHLDDVQGSAYARDRKSSADIPVSPAISARPRSVSGVQVAFPRRIFVRCSRTAMKVDDAFGTDRGSPISRPRLHCWPAISPGFV